MTILPHTLTTIDAGRTASCGKVTIFSTNGWDTNFDNLAIDQDDGD